MARRSVEAQFGSVSMVAMAALPLGGALGLRAVGRPVAWIPALIIAMTIAIAVFASLRDPASDGRRRIVVGTLAIFAGMFGLAYVVEPWTPAYDNTGLIGLSLGYVFTGAITGFVVACITEHGRGVARVIGGALATAVVGGVVGYFVGIPLYLGWTEDVVRLAPDALSREMVGLIVCGAVAAVMALLHGVLVRDTAAK